VTKELSPSIKSLHNSKMLPKSPPQLPLNRRHATGNL